MTTALLSVPIFRAFDSAGNSLAGGLLYSYAAGTATPQNTYSDAAGSVPNANPVVLDSTGSATVRLSTLGYKFVLKDSGGATQWTEDNVLGSYLSATDIGAATLAGNNVLTGVNKISATEPRLIFDESDQGTNLRLWDIDVQAAVLKLRTRTDADGALRDILTINRTGVINTPGFSQVAYKPADETETSDATLSNDADLTLPLAIGSYAFELFARILGTTGGISFSVNFSGTYTGSGVSMIAGTAMFNGAGSTLTAKILQNVPTASSYTAATLSGSNPTDFIHLSGTLNAVTSGTLGFNWAQNSSDAAGTTVGRGSWLKVTQLV